MLCEICEINKATGQYTEIVNDQKKVIRLCDSCAQKQGLQDPNPTAPKKASSKKKKSISLDMFLKSKITETVEKKEQAVCSNCQWTFAKFKKRGRLGCPTCYTTFLDDLRPILKEVHSNLKHTGKFPRYDGLTAVPGSRKPKVTEARLSSLKRELETAIETESFERAAELRDIIQDLIAANKVTSTDAGTP